MAEDRPDPPSDKLVQRRVRQAEALRANLRRRKQAAQDRVTGKTNADSDPQPESPEDTVSEH